MNDAVMGVVFDLDGTLTLPGAIDFERIRRRIGMPEPGSIMRWIEENAESDVDAEARFAIVQEEEDLGLTRMAPGQGLDALVDAIIERGATLHTAICTRNSPDALAAFDALLRRLGHPGSLDLFHVQITRDHHSVHLGRVIEDKPSHEPAHEIVRAWGLEERFVPHIAHEHDDAVHPELLFVGDNVDDVHAGRRAGFRTGLVLHGRSRDSGDPIHRAVDTTFDDLADVALALRRAR